METPEFFQQGDYYNNQLFSPEKSPSDSQNGDNLAIEDMSIEDLLDCPYDDNNNIIINNNGIVTDEAMFDNNNNNMTGGSGGASTDSSTVTAFDTSCNSSLSGMTENHHVVLGGDIGGCRNLPNGHFGSELCVPYDDLAELEWVSNFVEESFSSEDLQKMQLISGVKARTQTSSSSPGIIDSNFQQNEPHRAIPTPMFRPEVSVPAKARSKRSRAAPCNWTSRLLAVSSSPPNNITTLTTTNVVATSTMTPPPTLSSMSSSSESDFTTLGSGKKGIKHPIKKKENPESGGEERRCLHCMTDKTPQWRTGPMGPKTLCNACGVRYKSGRLVPEYRPASSPTFVLAKHSNSHRKVLEIRRQKEVQQVHHHQQQLLQQHGMVFDISNADDYLIHQHIGPDYYRQLI